MLATAYLIRKKQVLWKELQIIFPGFSGRDLPATDPSVLSSLPHYLYRPDQLDLDPKLPALKVYPQDIGRVLLNLVNNAFYATTQKADQAKNGYKPSVTVSTKLKDKNVELCVEDNGSGIPATVVDKIFMPFFTTKPTGSGTGLGLSLSYDIITKGHDGHLEVETEEGMGTRFIVRLPIHS